MTEIWTQAAIWLSLALLASLLSIWLRIATALSESVVGAIAPPSCSSARSWVRPSSERVNPGSSSVNTT